MNFLPTETLIWLLPLPPLLAFFIIILVTNRQRALSHTVAVGAAFLSWLGSMVVIFRAVNTEHLGEHPFNSFINWLPVGENWLQIGVLVDPLTAVSLFFVAWTILSIFLYSVGYHNFGQPKGDHDRAGLPPHGATVTDVHGHQHQVPSIEPMYARFFAFIGLFAFGMYTLVLSDNLLTLFVGWEIMGLCSYLLIGFWYGKPSARAAMIKAFITTRIGDVFMLLGIAYLYSATGTLSYRDIFYNEEVLHHLAETGSGFLGLSAAGLIGILLFIGTIGKSAQFPLHVWLPDAMEGPTPVSAMIHAATMVSAGVYMVIRVYPLMSAGMEHGHLTAPMTAMAIIGAFTALFGATIAVAQKDIKGIGLLNHLTAWIYDRCLRNWWIYCCYIPLDNACFLQSPLVLRLRFSNPRDGAWRAAHRRTYRSPGYVQYGWFKKENANHILDILDRRFGAFWFPTYNSWFLVQR